MELPDEATGLALKVVGTMVSTMFTTAWGAVSRRFAKAASQHDAMNEETVIAQLERDRERLSQLPVESRPMVAEIVRDRWTDQLQNALAKDPTILQRLRELAAGIEVDAADAHKDASVNQFARADGKDSRINQAGGNQYNFGAQP